LVCAGVRSEPRDSLSLSSLSTVTQLAHMIILGNGSLLRNAIETCTRYSLNIDYVLSHSDELESLCISRKIAFKKSRDFNNEKELILNNLSDNIIFSINNGQILTEEIISIKNIKIYNIHNGIIPLYRGRPEICVFFAILNKERFYGASLHEINKGIDTGRCIDQLIFEIEPHETFQSLMIKGIESCRLIFDKNIKCILSGGFSYINNNSISNLYTYNSLNHFDNRENNDVFMRAKKMGVFKQFYPRMVSAIEKMESRIGN
jgi:folate-dependent phosphoribosylglycinamide formyltransferase PurN